MKKTSKASSGDAGMSTVGPTGDVNSRMFTCFKLEDQEIGSVDVAGLESPLPFLGH